MERLFGGQILIECPNTIFHLYVTSEDELSKIEIFMKNIQSVKKMGLNDIYNWCNRQGIVYDTKFNFPKNATLEKIVRSFVNYIRLKLIYQWHVLPA